MGDVVCGQRQQQTPEFLSLSDSMLVQLGGNVENVQSWHLPSEVLQSRETRNCSHMQPNAKCKNYKIQFSIYSADEKRKGRGILNMWLTASAECFSLDKKKETQLNVISSDNFWVGTSLKQPAGNKFISLQRSLWANKRQKPNSSELTGGALEAGD